MTDTTPEPRIDVDGPGDVPPPLAEQQAAADRLTAEDHAEGLHDGDPEPTCTVCTGQAAATVPRIAAERLADAVEALLFYEGDPADQRDALNDAWRAYCAGVDQDRPVEVIPPPTDLERSRLELLPGIPVSIPRPTLLAWLRALGLDPDDLAALHVVAATPTVVELHVYARHAETGHRFTETGADGSKGPAQHALVIPVTDGPVGPPTPEPGGEVEAEQGEGEAQASPPVPGAPGTYKAADPHGVTLPT